MIDAFFEFVSGKAHLVLSAYFFRASAFSALIKKLLINRKNVLKRLCARYKEVFIAFLHVYFCIFTESGNVSLLRRKKFCRMLRKFSNECAFFSLFNNWRVENVRCRLELTSVECKIGSDACEFYGWNVEFIYRENIISIWIKYPDSVLF